MQGTRGTSTLRMSSDDDEFCKFRQESTVTYPCSKSHINIGHVYDGEFAWLLAVKNPQNNYTTYWVHFFGILWTTHPSYEICKEKLVKDINDAM